MVFAFDFLVVNAASFGVVSVANFLVSFVVVFNIGLVADFVVIVAFFCCLYFCCFVCFIVFLANDLIYLHLQYADFSRLTLTKPL